MHGRSPPSFFFTKKNPAEAGDVDGRMKPLASSSSMYAFMASDSGCDRGKTRPWVGVNWVAVRWHSHSNDDEVIVRLWSC